MNSLEKRGFGHNPPFIRLWVVWADLCAGQNRVRRASALRTGVERWCPFCPPITEPISRFEAPPRVGCGCARAIWTLYFISSPTSRFKNSFKRCTRVCVAFGFNTRPIPFWIAWKGLIRRSTEREHWTKRHAPHRLRVRACHMARIPCRPSYPLGEATPPASNRNTTAPFSRGLRKKFWSPVQFCVLGPR